MAWGRAATRATSSFFRRIPSACNTISRLFGRLRTHRLRGFGKLSASLAHSGLVVVSMYGCAPAGASQRRRLAPLHHTRPAQRRRRLGLPHAVLEAHLHSQLRLKDQNARGSEPPRPRIFWISGTSG